LALALKKLVFDFVDFGMTIVGGIISSLISILMWEWWKRPKLHLERILNDSAINMLHEPDQRKRE
jgi:hypothetical protein